MAQLRLMACLVLLATAPFATHARALRGGAEPELAAAGRDLLQVTFEAVIETGASGFSNCIDVPGAQAFTGNQIQQYPCNGTPAQKFIMQSSGWTTIRSVLDPSKCLDVLGWSTAEGAPVVLWDCNGMDNQLFNIQVIWPDRPWHFVAKPRHADGKCLDATSDSILRISSSCSDTFRFSNLP